MIAKNNLSISGIASLAFRQCISPKRHTLTTDKTPFYRQYKPYTKNFSVCDL